MKNLTIICSLLLLLCLSGCAKKEIDYVYIRQEIPSYLLEAEKVKWREMKTQSEAGVFILDLYEALEKCNYKIETIKEINA